MDKRPLHTTTRQLNGRFAVYLIAPRRAEMTNRLVVRVAGALFACGALPLHHAGGGQLLAVWRGRVATLGVKTDASRAAG